MTTLRGDHVKKSLGAEFQMDKQFEMNHSWQRKTSI